MDWSPAPFPGDASCVPAIRHWMAAGPGRARGGTRGETEPTGLRPPGAGVAGGARGQGSGVDRRGAGGTGGHGAGGLRTQPRRLVFRGRRHCPLARQSGRGRTRGNQPCGLPRRLRSENLSTNDLTPSQNVKACAPAGRNTVDPLSACLLHKPRVEAVARRMAEEMPDPPRGFPSDTL